MRLTERRRTQRKLKLSPEARVLLVAPMVEAAPWFPSLRGWLVTSPLPLPLSPSPLRQPHWNFLVRSSVSKSVELRALMPFITASGLCSSPTAKPIQHKSSVRWDVALVLRYLKYGKLRHTKLLNTRNLTLKAVFLTLLASGKRRGEVHALQNWLGNKNGNWSAVVLKPPENVDNAWVLRKSKTYTPTNKVDVPCQPNVEPAVAAAADSPRKRVKISAVTDANVICNIARKRGRPPKRPAHSASN